MLAGLEQPVRIGRLRKRESPEDDRLDPARLHQRPDAFAQRLRHRALELDLSCPSEVLLQKKPGLSGRFYGCFFYINLV